MQEGRVLASLLLIHLQVLSHCERAGPNLEGHGQSGESILLQKNYAQTTVTVEVACEDTEQNHCQLYKDGGYCETSPSVQAECRKTCGVCGESTTATTTTVGAACEDTEQNHCQLYKDEGYCETSLSVQAECRKTCNLCGRLLPQQNSSGRGCTCINACGASHTQNHRCDWCNVDESCSQRQDDKRGSYDYCSYQTDHFEALSATRKMDQIWEQVVSNSSSGPVLSPAETFGALMTQSMISTFDTVRDTLPDSRRNMKVGHQQGTVLQIDFEVDSGSPYSGMLAAGTHRGLMRLGSASPPEQATQPGLALKFLRSGVHSANTVALRGPAGSGNFFEEPLSTHGELLEEIDSLGKLSQASGCRTMTGISDLCSYAQNGDQVKHLNFPYELRFVAPEPMQFKVDPNATDKSAELLSKLAGIPKDTHLYDVLAKASPTAAWVRLGSIFSRSASLTSMFGDTQLFFRHQRMEEDFAKRPEWLPQIDRAFCDESVDSDGNLRPLSDWQCPGVVGVPPVDMRSDDAGL